MWLPDGVVLDMNRYFGGMLRTNLVELINAQLWRHRAKSTGSSGRSLDGEENESYFMDFSAKGEEAMKMAGM
jgi:hypothetical protein